MSSPLTLKAACRQLGTAGHEFVSAAWRAPFTGGKIRMVTVGAPVLFVTCGIAAVIYKIMKSILGAAYSKCSHTAQSFHRSYFQNKGVKPIPPKQKNPNQSSSRALRLPASLETPNPADKVKEVNPPSSLLTPLPSNVAEERNSALLKFLNLADTLLIKPWIVENGPVEK